MKREDCRLLGLVFHDIIYAYQRTVRETLGSCDKAILNLVECMCQNTSLSQLCESEAGFEELVSFMARKLREMGLGELTLEKIGGEDYLLRIDSCVWADTYHPQLKSHEVTCPWALIAMAVYQIKENRRVHVADSEFTPRGSITKIQPASKIVFSLVG